MGFSLLRNGLVLGGEGHEWRLSREREAEMMLAQGQLVTVVPLVGIERFELIEGPIGPLVPMAPAQVPLYAALLLKHSGQCVIQAPEWLSLSYLKRAVEREEELKDEFTETDMYLFENASVCLENCEIIEDIAEIRIQLKKLREVRMQKLLKGIEYIDTPIIGTNNLTFFEFRKIKEYLLPHLEIQKNLQ
ncbi:GINS complex subunit 2 [Nematocida homosporus]|uniref:GINS complex subunit 2 n=1 Tax=Nematocida homosporus TaxID=1912981 RepID=UPI002220FCD3|nr:GINS complex subunit 2 [Nematocida homosporus]KAI5184362.1 GINS complex subunit 2 [Nematocida homosporus]